MHALVALLLTAELGDAVAEDHEALVDVIGLLQGLALAPGLLGHLGSGQIDKVDLAVAGDINLDGDDMQICFDHK